MSKPEHICVRLDQELAQRLKAEASVERRSVSSFVRNIIADNLAAKPADSERSAA